MRISRVQIIVLLSICAICQAMLGAAQRPFTVKDSIEMSTFSDPFTRSPSAHCKMSPDGAHFLTVTTRGVLKRDEVVSTLWIFNTKSVAAYTKGLTSLRPEPIKEAEISAAPLALQSDSYGALIMKAQWSPDSASILFLAENSKGQRNLRRVSISTGRVQEVSGSDQDVVDYAMQGETIAYS